MEHFVRPNNISVKINNKLGKVWYYITDSTVSYLTIIYKLEDDNKLDCVYCFPQQNPDFHILFEALNSKNSSLTFNFHD